MLEGLDLDPYQVLGLSRGCTSDELRDAYRKKSKKHHPDGGGDDWAFRIVVRAYETVSQNLERDRFASQAREAPDTGRIRPGLHDKTLDAGRLVHVEIVWMRYEVDDVMGLIADRRSGEKRNLSGSLNIAWPGSELDVAQLSPAIRDRYLQALNAAFDDLRSRTSPSGANSRIVDGRFTASVGYPSGQTAWEAFKHFHVNLKARGLGVKQWTRDVTIPRETEA